MNQPPSPLSSFGLSSAANRIPYRVDPRQAIRRVLTLLVTTVAALSTIGLAEEVTVAYSVADEDSGGASIARIDANTGQILAIERLFDLPNCREPKKIRRSADNQVVAVTNVQKNGPHLFLWSAAAPDLTDGLQLGSIPDELRLASGLALLTVEDDSLVVVDVVDRQIKHTHRLNKILTPPASSPEDLLVDPDEQHVVVSVQKDSSNGKKKGSRLVVFDLPEVELVADLPLPRQHPNLHVADNPKEQGPGPEVLYISPRSDTLAVTLDLYGALGMMRWSAAKAGLMNAEDWTLVSTSDSPQLDGRSFPDRATPVTIDQRDFYLVCNAGEDGGSVLVDLARREVVWRGLTPAGLETPIYVPSLRRAFTVCSGKTKRRDGNDVVKSSHPRQSLIVYEFSPSQNGSEGSAPEINVTQLPLGAYTTQIAIVTHDRPWLLVAVGAEPNLADTLLTIDATSGEIKDSQPAGGIVGRFE